MEQAQAGLTPVWIVKALAGVITADVLIVIVKHWKGYDLSGKFLAIVLLATLVVLPASVAWGRIKRYDWPSLFPTYMLLMLATVLFGMH